MVVDDEDHIREIARLCLELVGDCEVVEARSGVEALEVANELGPDAILLDVMMPELDGPSTVRALRGDEATRAIPILLLTAKVHEADLARFDDLDVQGVISKPFDPMTLSAKVAEALGWSP